LAESSVDLIGRELFLASLVGGNVQLGPVMHRMVRQMEEVTLDTDESLFHAGERAEHFFFLVTGGVVRTRPSEPSAPPLHLGERSAVGILDAMMGRTRAHTAVATRPTRLLRLRSEAWLDFLEDDFEFAQGVISRLATEVYRMRLRPPPLGGFPEPPSSKPKPAGELHVLDRIIQLQGVAAFSRAGTQALAELAQLGSTRFSAADGILFEPGEMKGQLVVVASGEVRATWNEAAVSARFGAGDLVGGTGSIGNGAPPEVHAAAHTRAMVLPTEDYFDVMEEHFDLVLSALAAVGEEREALQDRGL